MLVEMMLLTNGHRYGCRASTDVFGSWPERIGKSPRGEPDDAKPGLDVGSVREELNSRSLQIGKGRLSRSRSGVARSRRGRGKGRGRL